MFIAENRDRGAAELHIAHRPTHPAVQQQREAANLMMLRNELSWSDNAEKLESS